MKVKSHSGLKKRLRVRKGGTVSFNKAAKRHLLTNKSKRQKKSMRGGIQVFPGYMQDVRRLMAGRVRIHMTRKRRTQLGDVVKVDEKSRADRHQVGAGLAGVKKADNVEKKA
ncbi:50S ribosomal protein L35 [Candidatus Peregrinibacteria bacterium]|nr:50S ribosomal protein L35 [Candidatus Peregrinibacteria bacterium]